MSISGRAIDISNYSGPVTGDNITAMLAANVKLVIVRLSLETRRNQLSIARQQIVALASAGVPWQGYFWNYYDEPPGPAIRSLEPAFGDIWAGYHGATLWLDDEDESSIGDDNYRWLRRAGSAARRMGFKPGIYTRPSLWNGTEREVAPGAFLDEFATWPLWLTAWGSPYGTRPNPIGRWESVTMAQYRQGALQIPGLGPFDPNAAFGVD